MELVIYHTEFVPFASANDFSISTSDLELNKFDLSEWPNPTQELGNIKLMNVDKGLSNDEFAITI